MNKKQPQRPHFLDEWMDAKTVTASQLAAQTGLNKGTISRLLSGTSPQKDTQAKLAKFFGTTAEALFRHPDEAWFVEFFAARSREEIERMKIVLETAFPRPGPMQPASRKKRGRRG